MLAALRLYLRDHGITNPEQTAIVLFKRNDPARFWDRPRDNNPLLIKPSGWTDEDVRMIEQNGAKEGYEVAYAPGLGAHPGYEAYRRIIEASDVEAELAALGAETKQRFSIATDDRPFIFDIFDNGRYLESEFWQMPTPGTEHKLHEIAHLIRVVFIGIVVAGVIAPGGLLMGHLFPQGLVLVVSEDSKLVPWAWGINGAMSTIGAGVAPLAAQVWGSSALFLGVAALYGAILVLPTTRSVRASLEPTTDTSAAISDLR